jgi:putative FmdB family regulatory protein
MVTQFVHVVIITEREENMPTYEYRCEVCGKVFEVTILIADLPTTTIKCPICFSENVKKSWNIPFVIYKDKDFTKHVEGSA